MSFPALAREGSDEALDRGALREAGAGGARAGAAGNLELLLQAIRGGDDELVGHLVNSGAVVPRDPRTRTKAAGPLEVAAAYERERVVLLLLEKGFAAEYALGRTTRARPPESKVGAHPSSPSPRRSHGRSLRPHRRASRISRSSEAQVGYDAPVSFASIRQPSTGRTNPLHWGCYKGNLIITCALLRHGFRPAAVDTEGNTSLHLAATACNEKGGQHLVILELLLSEELELDERNVFGNSAYQLATDARAKALLRRVAEDPSSRQNLLSIRKIVAAEEDLQRQLMLVRDAEQQELQRVESGWNVFVDGIERTAAQEIRARTELEGDEVSGAASVRSADGAEERTKFLSQMVEQLDISAAQLKSSLKWAQTCYVSQDLVRVARVRLRELLARNCFEHAIVRLLREELVGDATTALSNFMQFLRVAQANGIPRHVFLRATRVYLFLEARTRLLNSFTAFSSSPTREANHDDVEALETRLNAFGKHRIHFGPQHHRDFGELTEIGNLEKQLEIVAAIELEDRKKRKTKIVKKGKGASKKKDGPNNGGAGENDDEEDRNATDSDSATDGTPGQGETDAGENMDPDDHLIHFSSKLLLRMRLEVRLLSVIDEETAGGPKSDLQDRVTRLETNLRAFETLVRLAERMMAPARGDLIADPASTNTTQVNDDPTEPTREDPFLVPPELVSKAQARLKQLQRELKVAKRHLNEKNSKAQRAGTSAKGAKAK